MKSAIKTEVWEKILPLAVHLEEDARVAREGMSSGKMPHGGKLASHDLMRTQLHALQIIHDAAQQDSSLSFQSVMRTWSVVVGICSVVIAASTVVQVWNLLWP